MQIDSTRDEHNTFDVSTWFASFMITILNKKFYRIFSFLLWSLFHKSFAIFFHFFTRGFKTRSIESSCRRDHIKCKWHTKKPRTRAIEKDLMEQLREDVYANLHKTDLKKIFFWMQKKIQRALINFFSRLHGASLYSFQFFIETFLSDCEELEWREATDRFTRESIFLWSVFLQFVLTLFFFSVAVSYFFFSLQLFTTFYYAYIILFI